MQGVLIDKMHKTLDHLISNFCLEVLIKNLQCQNYKLAIAISESLH